MPTPEDLATLRKPPSYPGVFSSAHEIALQQRRAEHAAAIADDVTDARREQYLQNERELRNRAALKSAVIWVAIIIPLTVGIFGSCFSAMLRSAGIPV